jgi:hypothetical protein
LTRVKPLTIRGKDRGLGPGCFISDERGQIVRHIVTIGIAFVIVILVLVEIGPVILLRFSSIQETEDLASDAALQYLMNNGDEVKVRELTAEKMRLMGFSEDEIADSVVQFLPAGPRPKTVARVTAVRYAKTLVSRHISWLKKLEKISNTKEAPIQR